MNTSALRWCYRVSEGRITPELTGSLARLAGCLVGGRVVDGWLSAFERRFVSSGWPGRAELCINLHLSRFAVRVRRAMRRAPAPQQRRRPAARSPLRVGIIGRFAGLLGFPPGLLAGCPPTVALSVFDAPFRGQAADYLTRLPIAYHLVDLDDPVPYGSALRQTASVIERARLDLLINVNTKVDAHMLLDIVDTACVANYCSGSDLLHHPRVDLELLWQMPTGYDLRDGKLWCQQTGLPVPGAPTHRIRGFYDARDLGAGDPAPWPARDPLIVSHGSLYKFAVPAFMNCMLDVLDAVAGAEWVLVGKDNGRALGAIMTHASARGLSARVRYEGEFSAIRNAKGELSDPGWARLQQLLGRARLAPDPFPVGSGSARFEAYMLGAPSVHMGPDAREGSLPLNSSELPLLSIPMATAKTVSEYRDLAVRCLADAAFADAVQREQLAAALLASDPAAWWCDISEAFRSWSSAAQTT